MTTPDFKEILETILKQEVETPKNVIEVMEKMNKKGAIDQKTMTQILALVLYDRLDR